MKNITKLYSIANKGKVKKKKPNGLVLINRPMMCWLRNKIL